MADDYDLHCVEDLEDDDDSYEDDLYDVNKENDLGEPEDQAQDEFERRLEEFELSAKRASPIENAISEMVGENSTPQTQSQGHDDQMNTGGRGGVKAPAMRKGRGPTTSFKKPTGAMVLEYDNKGQPTGEWRREYGNQVGMCARKIPITFGWRQVPPGLIQTFWDDTRKLFNTRNDADKRRLFESLVAERFRGFKTFLTNGWILWHRQGSLQVLRINHLSMQSCHTTVEYKKYGTFKTFKRRRRNERTKPARGRIMKVEMTKLLRKKNSHGKYGQVLRRMSGMPSFFKEIKKNAVEL
ncbi:uncharacterized protein LOC110713365 [Chenopodium quinoa]|uniref:uncharacterized protein LOC110713365 n=1 Tax=Chenopodium quinoa TaxID=63459 RepID=UPI000B79946D|nr:uncharacterized protein LOC110713365 [Chenopodium quinoa]